MRSCCNSTMILYPSIIDERLSQTFRDRQTASSLLLENLIQFLIKSIPTNYPWIMSLKETNFILERDVCFFHSIINGSLIILLYKCFLFLYLYDSISSIFENIRSVFVPWCNPHPLGSINLVVQNRRQLLLFSQNHKTFFTCRCIFTHLQHTTSRKLEEKGGIAHNGRCLHIPSVFNSI